MKRVSSRLRHLADMLGGNVLMLGVVSFFTDVSSEMIYPLIPAFLAGLTTPQQAALYLGVMDGIAESTSSLLKIASGRLSDRIRSRKGLAVLGYSISTFTKPFMSLATAGWHVIVLRFLDRAGKGIRTAPRDALISTSVKPSRWGLAFAFHRAMDHAGAVCGPLASALLLYPILGYAIWHGGREVATAEEMEAMRWLFALAVVPGLCAVVTLAAKVKEIPWPATPAPMDGAHEPPGRRLPGRYYLYLASVGLFTLGNSSDLFLILYAKTTLGAGLGSMLAMWMALNLSKIAFSLPGGTLADRLGRPQSIVLGWFVYTVVYAGIATAGPSPGWFWMLVVLYGAYYGLTEGAERALVAEMAGEGERGKAYGLYHGVVGLASLPASLVFGLFWMARGARTAFLVGAALAGLATLLLLLTVSGQGRRTALRP